MSKENGTASLNIWKQWVSPLTQIFVKQRQKLVKHESKRLFPFWVVILLRLNFLRYSFLTDSIYLFSKPVIKLEDLPLTKSAWRNMKHYLQKKMTKLLNWYLSIGVGKKLYLVTTGPILTYSLPTVTFGQIISCMVQYPLDCPARNPICNRFRDHLLSGGTVVSSEPSFLERDTIFGRRTFPILSFAWLLCMRKNKISFTLSKEELNRLTIWPDDWDGPVKIVRHSPIRFSLVVENNAFQTYSTWSDREPVLCGASFSRLTPRWLLFLSKRHNELEFEDMLNSGLGDDVIF